MTVGDGIFWSVVILVCFASIVLLTKYNRWRTFLKIFFIFAALGMVIGISAWGYFKYENRPQIMSSLNGIQLGMSEVDVTLQKGKPDQVSELNSKPGEFRKVLLFNDSSDSHTYAILRGEEESLVVTIVCDEGGYGRVLGFGQYSSERAVIKKLGEPANISISETGTEKLLSYPEWNAAFEVRKGNIVQVCVTSNSRMRYITEYGKSENPEEE